MAAFKSADFANAITRIMNATGGKQVSGFKKFLIALEKIPALTKGLIATGAAISIIVGVISAIKKAQEEARKAAVESSQAFDEQIKSIQDYKDEISKLKSELDKGNLSEQEAYDVRKQLLGIQDDIIDKLGTEAGAFDILKGSVDDASEALDHYSMSEANALLTKNNSEYQKAIKAVEMERVYSATMFKPEWKGMSNAEKELRQRIEDIFTNEFGNDSITWGADEAGWVEFILGTDARTATEGLDHVNDALFKLDKELAKHTDGIQLSDVVLGNWRDTLRTVIKEAENSVSDDQYQLYDAYIQNTIRANETLFSVQGKLADGEKAYNEALLETDPEKKAQSIQDAYDSILSLDIDAIAGIDSTVGDYFDKKINEFKEKAAGEIARIQLKVDLDTDDSYWRKAIRRELDAFRDETGKVDLLDVQNTGNRVKTRSSDYEGWDAQESAYLRLKAAADHYDISIEELIDGLCDLGEIAGKVGPEVENALGGKAASVDTLDKVKDAVSSLNEAFKDVKEKGAVSFDSLKKIIDAFSEKDSSGNMTPLIDGLDEYRARLAEVRNDIPAVTSIINEMTDKFIEAKLATDDLAASDVNQLEAALKAGGIENAHAVAVSKVAQAKINAAAANGTLLNSEGQITDAMIDEIAKLYASGDATEEAAMKQKLLAMNTAFSDGKIGEFITSLGNEYGASENTKAALVRLATQMVATNNTGMDFKGQISALQDLAKQAGVAAATIMAVNALASSSEVGTPSQSSKNGYASMADLNRQNYQTPEQIQQSAINSYVNAINDAVSNIEIPGLGPAWTSDSSKSGSSSTVEKTLYEQVEDQFEAIKDAIGHGKTMLENQFHSGMDSSTMEDYRDSVLETIHGIGDEINHKITDAGFEPIDWESILFGNIKHIERGSIDYNRTLQDVLHNTVVFLEKYQALHPEEDLRDAIESAREAWYVADNEIEESWKNAYDRRSDDIRSRLELLGNQHDELERLGAYDEANENLEIQEALYQELMDLAHELAEEARAYYLSLGYSVEETEALVRALGFPTTWWKNYNAKLDAAKKRIEALKNAAEELGESLDDIQNVYQTLLDAGEEYHTHGFLSVDSLQKVFSLEPKYLQYLTDENGRLNVNEDALQRVIAARTEDMSVKTAQAYLQQVYNALVDGETKVISDLIDVMDSSTESNWNNVDSMLALIQTYVGTGSLTQSQFNVVSRYVSNLKKLTDTATKSVSKWARSLHDGYISEKDAVNKIFDVVKEYIQWELNQQVEALEKQKSDFDDIIARRKELIQLARKESDHDKDIAKRIKEIAKLQSRIELLRLDTSREAQAERIRLEEQLQEKQSDLADAQADYFVETQQDALDKEQDAADKAFDQQIKDLKETLDSEEELYQATLNRVTTAWGNGWSEFYSELSNWNSAYGTTLALDLDSAWSQALTAAQRYGSYVNAFNEVNKALSSDEQQIAPRVVPVKSDGHAPAGLSVGDYVVTGGGVYQIKSVNSDGTYDSGGSPIESQSFETMEDVYAYADTYRRKIGGTYHTGGGIGGTTLKQNEELARLQNGELVLTKEHQKGLESVLDMASWMREYADMSKLKSLVYDTTPRAGTTIFEMIDRMERKSMAAKAGDVITGGDIVNNVNVNITHDGSMSDSDYKRYGQIAADAALDKLADAMSRRGMRNINPYLLKP